MRILLVHNSYQYHGGEDVVFQSERDLLNSAGHHVSAYTRSNHEIGNYGWRQRVSLAPRAVWAWDTLKQLRQRITSERPDIAHFHNTFPLVSPSAYLACREAGVPVIQTLHNPRLLCPAATLYRAGAVCQDCISAKAFLPAIIHGCYRNSRVQTAAVASMLAIHRKLRTWDKLVDRYIASSDFFARKFGDTILPKAKIVIKPHFVPRNRCPAAGCGEYALFVGRLALEKGVATLLRASTLSPHVPLKIRGDGPLFNEVHRCAALHNLPIEWLPRLAEEELILLFQKARFLIWPSEGLYETFGLAAIEAFACGVPVIASNLGVMAGTVRHGDTGLLFTAGNAEDLAAKVEWAWAHPAEMKTMGLAARAEYEAKYTPEANYNLLIGIYSAALAGGTAGSRDAKLDLIGAPV